MGKCENENIKFFNAIVRTYYVSYNFNSSVTFKTIAKNPGTLPYNYSCDMSVN